MKARVSTTGLHSQASGDSRGARFAPWIARIVLATATVIFGGIALRYITDPAAASERTGVTLNTVLAYTTTRVGFGAFPLALALYSFTSLILRRLFEGVRLILTLSAVVIGVRLYSLVVDGYSKESVVLFIPESILLALAVSALFLDSARRRQAEAEIRP